jgi:hypothetical protein
MPSFLAPANVLGWSAGDWCSVAAALLLTRLPWHVPGWFRELAVRPLTCTVLLFLLPICLRLALLPRAGAPVPSGADDFGYLFLADTLRHLRLANPPLPFAPSFEQIFVLQTPTRASIFPLGQGIVLALGWMILGTPWAGVLLACGAFTSSCYWMLRGWVSPQWALTGGLLAALEFGPLCYWTNCYWGGAVSATAGCLVFGALGRLSRRRRRDAALLGIGLALQALTRQYEFFLLLIVVASFLIGRRRFLPIAGLCLAPALVLIAAQNKAVTDSVRTLPYLLYRYQYGVPATFTFQSNPAPHAELNQEQELDYRAESAVHGDQPETVVRYLKRLWMRVRFYRFFLSAPLYLALAAYAIRARNWIAAAIGVFVLGSNFYPYFYPHYIAAITCLFLLAALLGLRRMKPAFAAAILLACFAQFAFWYGARCFGVQGLQQYESWDYVNGGDPQGRIAVAERLAHEPGKQLVFVHYSPVHGFAEWVHNAVDLEASPVIWVHDLSRDENEKVLGAYPRRRAWLLEPDESPPKLLPYTRSTSPFEDVR